jgi:Pyruvate/2-oxoacid:ferredoxin oxidoreductase delta subunit
VAVRKIIKIDEEKCDGCGLCIPSCEEGALQIIDGKARLVSDVYCDGLGACLGECPRGALSMEEREAVEFDEEAAREHVARRSSEEQATQAEPPRACPGLLSQTLEPAEAPAESAHQAQTPSALRNWPVQIELAPVNAPYFDGARLLLAADCVPFAFADFHRVFISGRTVLVGCPKLDDPGAYREKLAELFRRNDITSIEVAHMEVPCCYGLAHLVTMALQDSGKDIPLSLTRIGVRGDVQETTEA